MERTCSTCFYGRGGGCEVLKFQVESNCYSWADEAEAKRREAACNEYAMKFGGSEVTKNILPKEFVQQRLNARIANEEARGGKSVKETLDEHFNWYYLQGLPDSRIARELHVDIKRVCDYRRDHGLPSWKERNRPVGAGAAS